MKYYVIAGEPSGDLHGANLVQGLLHADPSANIRCWGGDRMAAAGAVLAKHYRELAFMGFTEVVRNLPTILRNFRFAKSDITAFAPDCLILVDYPGFNLRMAKWAKQQGLRVFYYVSPQLWAWHTGRVEIVRRCVERMFVIFPFEVDFYRKHGVEVGYAGHPLPKAIAAHQPDPDFHLKNGLDADRPLLALLPGSRRQEVERMLGTMLLAASQFPDLQPVVAKAPSLPASLYYGFLRSCPSAKMVDGQTYDLLSHAHAALVTSGTATLETALFGVPQVVCYKAGAVSFALAKRLVNKDLSYISIVNLIAGEQVVMELIQDDFTEGNCAAALKKLMDERNRQRIAEGYLLVKNKLVEGRGAAWVAKEISTALLS